DDGGFTDGSVSAPISSEFIDDSRREPEDRRLDILSHKEDLLVPTHFFLDSQVGRLQPRESHGGWSSRSAAGGLRRSSHPGSVVTTLREAGRIDVHEFPYVGGSWWVTLASQFDRRLHLPL